MSLIARRSTVVGVALASVLPTAVGTKAIAAGKSVGQKWIDGWNSSDPEMLVSAFTPDGIYEDVTFSLKKQGSAELRDLHRFFHDSVDGLYVKLIASYVANGHGTIEWMFGGKDVGVFKTGRPFEVQGVSVIQVRDGRISRDLDYYDAATIMKQVGKLPSS